MRWTEENFQTDAITLARNLIGQTLLRDLDGHHVGGVIVETEAYLGVDDRAAHSFGGRRSPRIESMYATAGTAYVYLIYGLHHCFNVVCGEIDEPTAVLIRAIEPTIGLERIRLRRTRIKADRALCSGPGRLCEALAITRDNDGEALYGRSKIWIEETRTLNSAIAIDATPRVGVDYAGEWAKKPLRFCLHASKWVSKKPR